MSSQFSATNDAMERPAAASTHQTGRTRIVKRLAQIAIGICVTVVGLSQLCRGLVLLTGATNYGMVLKVNQSDLYYTTAVSKEDATRLQDFLIRSKVCGDSQISMQLTKSGSTRQFRIVVKPGFEKDKGYIATVQEMGETLSTRVFGGAPLEVHLCDDHFRTLRVVSATAVEK
jgi:hypothetical protein